ncbi:MAG: hypothetical protein H6Q64_1842, partial [Firmicutes bacterium]|nr:hypothetical protein [Bacillota bacterium]
TEIIMLGAVFSSFSMGVNNFIRAEGNPKISMYTQLLGAFIDVILNYLFIFKFGWGVKGSALATIIAQFVSALWVLSYFLTGRSLVKLRFRNMRLQWPILSSIMAIGFAPFAMQIAASIQQVILNRTLMVHGGDIALSAIGIVMSISTMLFMPVLGVSQGAQPIIGYNFGARQYDRVRETWKLAVWAGTAIVLAGYLVVHIWPTQLVGLFSEGDQALTALTTHAMLVYLALIPVIGFQIMSSTYFQAVGKARQAAVLSLSRQILFFIPLLLILPRYWGVEGVWRAAPLSDLLAVCLSGTLMFFEMRSLKKDELHDLAEKQKRGSETA